MKELSQPNRIIEGMTFASRPELVREPVRIQLPAQQPNIEAQRVRRYMLRTPRDGRR